MLIEVNFTIIIQMINFFICFLLLKYLLLKPAVKYLQQEEKKEDAVKEKILNQENLLKNKLIEKKQTWSKYEQYFKKACPKHITKKIIIPQQTKQELQSFETEISAKEIENLAKHAQKAFIEGIDNARK